MSLKDNAQEAWEEHPNLLEEADDPDYARQCFLAGYMAACKDLNEELVEPVPRQYGNRLYPALKSSFCDQVFVDTTYLQELRLLGEE